VRVILATVLGAGVAGLVAVPEPTSFLFGFAAMLLGFLLAGAKAAVDLIELTRAELAADAIALAALGLALTQITSGSTVRVGALIAVALVAQGFPRAVTMARCLRRSTSHPTPPGSA
jgi:hypothetical protein